MPALTLQLADDEVAIVGYGSLLSVPSVGRTLGREYTGPFVLCSVEGWRRAWNVAMPNQAFYYESEGARVYPANILYLNAQANQSSSMNCSLFVIKRKELTSMDDREWIYDRLVVTENLRGVSVEGGDAMMYVARPERVLDAPRDRRHAAIRASYLRVVESALQLVVPEFRKAYLESTDPTPQELIIDDRLDPDRPSPWAASGPSYSPQLTP